MNKIVKTSLIVLFSICTFLGCSYRLDESTGKVETRSFDVRNFKKVVLEGPMQAKIVHSTEYKAEVTLNSNLYSKLNVYVTKDVLYVSFKSNELKEYHTYNVFIKAPSITDINLSNLRRAEISGFADNSADMNLTYTGSGLVTLDTAVKKLRVNTAGTGDVVIQGKAEYLVAEIIGAGNLRAFNTAADTIIITSKSSGNAELTSGKKLEATILSSGNIVVKGKVDQLTAKISGSGSLKAFGTIANSAEIFCNNSGNAEITVEKQLSVELTGSGGVKYYTNNTALKRKLKRLGTGRIERIFKKNT